MNLKNSYAITISMLLVIILCFGCIEPFIAVTETFEDVLVIEATITDELKVQEIKVSRTYGLENGVEPNYVSNAVVSVEENNSITYNFKHTAYGVYESVEPFQAQEGMAYVLKVSTANGRNYSSTAEILSPKVEIEKVYGELIDIEEGTGVQIFVDSESIQNDANYFRYEYEETYQIIANRYFPFDLSLTPEDWPEFGGEGLNCQVRPVWVRRPLNEKTCYLSDVSNDILLTNINRVNESRVLKYPIRFIREDDHLLRDRYSILVKQFVQSADANNFYRILKKLGDDESLLIDNQPGFVQGNIFSEEDKNEKVIGFFDVSPVSSKRIFFDYKDFEIENKPKYLFECEEREYNFAVTGGLGNERAILFNLFSNFGYKLSYIDRCTVVVINKECGNCTSFASGEKPTFWED